MTRKSGQVGWELQRMLATLAKDVSAVESDTMGLANNARHHRHKLVALSELYGSEAVARAIDKAPSFAAFGSDYLAH